VNEGLFALRQGSKLNRRPDVAFVSYEQWAADRPVDRGNAWHVVPDLMVEVVSPANYAKEIPERIRDYFDAGSRRVWIVYPTVRLVYLYDSSRVIKIVGMGDAIADESLFPGLCISVEALFEDLGGAEPESEVTS
jgi:Uma2 family endonuclease